MEKRRKKFPARRLVHKYTLEIRDEDTFEKKRSFRLSRLDVLAVWALYSLLLAGAVIVVIVYTPLREHIPGYQDVNLSRILIETRTKVDSLEVEIGRKNDYLSNLYNILNGREEDTLERNDSYASVSDRMGNLSQNTGILSERSVEDSLLRSEIELEGQFNLTYESGEAPLVVPAPAPVQMDNILMYPPLQGIITDSFNVAKSHYGIDIVTRGNEAVKAMLDGMVILATWTSETGHVIAVQHGNNLVSFYKHNAMLLKKAGEVVQTGEAIAIVGDSGDLSTGPHLHFELWHNGKPVDPLEFIVF